MNIFSFRQCVRLELWQNSECMCPEVVPLGLQQCCRETLRTIPVEPAQSSAEGWNGDSQSGGLSHNITPRGLRFVYCLIEEVIEQQVLQFLVLYLSDSFVIRNGTLISFGDVAKEDRTNNATSAPHKGNSGVVEFPAIVMGGSTHKHKSLCVGDKLGCIECLEN